MRKGYIYITSRQNILPHNELYSFTHNEDKVDITNIRVPRVN